ncbi:MAG: hypothetical protein KDD55_02380, partial [Bdellovibrionales bacterium]|nr:hypothetical protein [Bdellovibrionales bacterium]
LGEKDGQGEFKLTFNGTSVTVPVDINGNWQQDLLAGYNDLSRRSSHASSSPTTTPASDVDISKMSRAEMEKAFVELSQDAAIQQTQAERLLTLEQNLRTIPRARFRTDEEYQVAVQQEMNKWSNDVERAEARQGQDIARDLQRAQGDYDREYRNATNKATNVAREQIAIENRINMRAERIRAKQNDFANDVREVKGLTRVEQAWNTIGTLDIPKKNREPIVDYLGSDVMTRKEESVRLMDEQLDRYSSVEHRDFGDPSTMLSQMDDEKLRSMLSNLQGQRNEASARYSNVRERLDQYSDDAAFEDAIEGTMDQVRSTAVATQTERATLEAMRLETQQLKEFTTEAQTALLQARNADQSFGTYETEMNGRHQAARGALQNWKKGQDASILGGAAKTAEKEARREIDEAIKRGVGRIFGR